MEKMLHLVRKTIIAGALMALALPFASHAQVRNLQGMSSLGVCGGITGNGFYGGALFEHILAHKWDIKTEVNAEFASYKSVSFGTYNLWFGVNYTVFNLGEHVFFKAGLGPVASLGRVADASKLDAAVNPSLKFNVGAYLEAQADIFTFGNLIATPYFKQGYFFLNPLGSWSYQAGLALKYQF